MNTPVEVISFVLIAANVIFSYQGFNKPSLQERYLFSIDGILLLRQRDRLLTSGFLHANWMHLLFNMYVLYAFSGFFARFPTVFFVILYAGSLLGGNLLTLWIRKNQGSYRALGASGAISGLLFSYAIFDPWSTILLFFVLPIWSWLFALLYVLFSLYGIRTQRDNIGHEAHLGGALVGLLITLLFEPRLLIDQAWITAAIVVPTAAFFYVTVRHPHWLMIRGSFREEFRDLPKKVSMKQSPKIFRTREEEVNFLLDKGYDRLSPKEKQRLKELSEN